MAYLLTWAGDQVHFSRESVPFLKLRMRYHDSAILWDTHQHDIGGIIANSQG